MKTIIDENLGPHSPVMLVNVKVFHRGLLLFCDQCQGYVEVLAAPDHLKKYPDHKMRMQKFHPGVS